MTQNKARRTNKIDFLQLPWAQEVPSSNLGAPTINSLNNFKLFPRGIFTHLCRLRRSTQYSHAVYSQGFEIP